LYKFYHEGTLNYLDYSLTHHSCDQVHWPLKFEQGQIGGVIEILNYSYGINLDYDNIESLYYKLYREFPGDKFVETMNSEKLFDHSAYIFPPQWNDASVVLFTESAWKHPIEDQRKEF